MADTSKPVLVIGATGYVGGRLVPRLLEAGYRVRAMGRSMEKLRCRPWASHPNLELAQGDVLDPNSLTRASKGCHTVYYLVHSMVSAGGRFAEADRRSAKNMVGAARKAGLERIVYLSGLGNHRDPTLSKHLRSRHEVEQILKGGAVKATVLRSAMILGSGSASFEILRYLSDRLPVMVTPQWIKTLVQPIAISNVLAYLIGCLEHDETAGETYDIGGPEVLSYEKLIELYAEEAGLPRRHIMPIPLLTPRLSALWIHLVTPIPASIAQPLAEGLATEVICRDNRIRSIIPQKLLNCRETIRLALEKVEQQKVETCWSDAGALLPPEWTHCGDADYAGGSVLECGYKIRIKASPEEIWQHVVRIGGENGWYFADYLWGIRGLLDRLLGGAGLNRGRRHPTQLYVGDALDFWRVLEIEAPYRLVLLAEMKLPGEAVLEFRVRELSNGDAELRQLARFLPHGLAGLSYWYGLYPFHGWIFGGMLQTIAKAVGKPVVKGPERFTPTLQHACRIDSEPLDPLPHNEGPEGSERKSDARDVT